MLISVSQSDSGLSSMLFHCYSNTTLSCLSLVLYLKHSQPTPSSPSTGFAHAIWMLCVLSVFFLIFMYVHVSLFIPTDFFSLTCLIISWCVNVKVVLYAARVGFYMGIWAHVWACFHPFISMCNMWVCVMFVFLSFPLLLLFFLSPSLFLPALISSPSAANQPVTCPITGCVLGLGSG